MRSASRIGASRDGGEGSSTRRTGPMIRDFDQLLAPIVVLTLVWIFCLQQVWRGWTTGRMSYTTRSAGSDLSTGDRIKGLERTSKSWSFWSLFVFYLVVVLAVPLMIGYALLSRM
jgi:polyferredoxin